jgi:putative polyhydroxyalkanoate system protein
MASIDICRRHGIGRLAARRWVEELVEQLDENYVLEHCWEGDVLHFRRTGIHGRMEVSEAHVHIQCKLGPLLRPLRGRLEGQIEHYLDQLLS